MQSKATTVKAYLAELPADRREALETVRAVICKSLNPGFEEGMQYGMIGYFIPHAIYPPGYHCDPKQPLPFAGIASQKNHMSIYLGCVYGDEGKAAKFKKAWAATGKKLDMGKACIRFKKIEHLPLDVIAATIKNETTADYIAYYEHAIKTSLGQSRKTQSKKSAANASPTKKSAANKSTSNSLTSRAKSIKTRQHK